ncbi:protealysin inhibitor emfourin [Halotia wernerae UHCC 0503]|nr:protealysin inhibitor emfourin [Halotia wernerae UHCC 0503]
MRISFERTGGFAGISKRTTLDTATLPPKEANELPRLVEAANLFNLPVQITSSHPQSDRFQYKLTVEDNGKQHTVTVSETALPGTLRPLIEWLNHAAQKKS